MNLRNTYLRYGSVAMAFHWVIALLIVINIALGLWLGEFLELSDPMTFVVAQWHKSIGLTVLVLSVLRVVWRLMNPHPPPPWPTALMRGLSMASHYAFYFLILAIPITGYVMASASPLGIETNYFGLFIWPNLPFFSGMTRSQLHPIHETWETVHTVLAWSAIVLLPIHVGAALYHHYRLRDNVLKRMLPGTEVKT